MTPASFAFSRIKCEVRTPQQFQGIGIGVVRQHYANRTMTAMRAPPTSIGAAITIAATVRGPWPRCSLTSVSTANEFVAAHARKHRFGSDRFRQARRAATRMSSSPA